MQVGNEFSSVEALWSQFENVMAKDPDAEGQGTEEEEEEDEEGGSRIDETEVEAEHKSGR